MTRIYLSPTATFFAKTGLMVLDVLIELFYLVSYPIRKITVKSYLFIILCAGGLHGMRHFDVLMNHLLAFCGIVILFGVSIIAVRLLYKYLKKTLGPKIAVLINSPMGIPLNKFHSA